MLRSKNLRHELKQVGSKYALVHPAAEKGSCFWGTEDLEGRSRSGRDDVIFCLEGVWAMLTDDDGGELVKIAISLITSFMNGR